MLQYYCYSVIYGNYCKIITENCSKGNRKQTNRPEPNLISVLNIIILLQRPHVNTVFSSRAFSAADCLEYTGY